jgi:transposase
MSIITIGIDLAKHVFAVHGVDENGKAVLVKPKVAREHLLVLVAQLPPCLIGMEACSGAHHWARLFRQHGHTVKLMAPKFVTPYRMSGRRGKNDAADAAAICEAVSRPKMRFVPIKEEHQQIILCLHRTRQGFVEERTATYNRLRGLIAEFGIVLAQKVACLRREIGAHLEALPGYAKRCIGDLLAHADQLDARIVEYDRAIAQAARDDARSQRLMQRPGIEIKGAVFELFLIRRVKPPVPLATHPD